jgi:aminocarboxymuconate-semialdehyde decarboxylase
MYLSNAGRTTGYGLPNTVGRPHDTDIAVSRLMFSGLLRDNPGIRMLLVHGGASLPYLWGRILRNRDIGDPSWADPQQALESLYFDSVVYRGQALRFLVDFAGAGRVLLGSDYPFPIMDPDPLDVVRQAGLDSGALDGVCGHNARNLFGHSHFTRNRDQKGRT